MTDSFLNKICLFLVAVSIPTTCDPAAAIQQARPSSSKKEILTVAESSGFTSTSTSAEVEQFIDECILQAPFIEKRVIGKSVEGRDLIALLIANDYYEPGEKDERNVVLILGNIHPGECSGKEALLMILRDFVAGANQNWLDKNVIVMVPNYNPDGNDRIGLLNRPGQIGPVNGMGRRENAQELDLNRDFGKLEAPETRALVKLFDLVKPHVFIDCHTTNGSKHRYSLTYDIPHNPATSASIRDYMRNEMMPVVTKDMEKKGQSTFYYGNFNSDQTQWYSFGHEPRYSTEYAGMRGCLAVLVEDYSYIGYQERIVASKEFVSSLLNYATERRTEIRSVLNEVEEDWHQTMSSQPYRHNLSLGAKPVAFDKKVVVKGFQGETPHDFECEHISNYVSTKSAPMPFGYIIPKTHPRVVDRLQMHGVKVEMIATPFLTEVEVDTVTAIKELPFVFQKHRNRTVEASRKSFNENIQYGDFVVFTDQPLGRLAAYLLEAESDDGFVYWNFFDEVLKVGKRYPVIRVPDPIDIRTETAIEFGPLPKINLQLIDGPDSLLGSPSTPVKWFGKTNLLNTNFSQRQTLLEARTASFAPQPALPYVVAQLQAALLEQGLERPHAISLASAAPTSTVNGKYSVVADEKRSFVVWSPEENRPLKIQEVGAARAQTGKASAAPSEQFSGPGELFEFSSDESKLAFVSAAGFHVLDLNSGIQTMIPVPTDQHLIGKLDWVYQEELYGRGNFKGYWWSPSDDQIAFLSLDESPVEAFIVMDHLPIRGNPETTYYPKAGEALPVVKLGVVDAHRLDEITWLDLSQYGNQELLISRVSWSRDGDVLLVQIQNREQTWLDLVAADRTGKNVRVLFRDQTPAWIESPGDPIFVSENEFLWLSPRDGIRRLYRYNLDGKLLGTLTEQDWEVRELIGIDPDNQFVYFTGSEKNEELHCYRLSQMDNKLSRITHEPGTHQVEFSHDFSLFLDRYSNTRSPVETRVCQADGTVLRKLNARSDDRLDYVQFSQPEFTSVPVGNGLELDAMFIKPLEFSAFQKFPVLIHVYAGPQAPRVRNRFDGAFYLWHQMLAQQGYVVCVLDNRSASYRNTKGMWPIHKQLAKHEMADIEGGVHWLKQQSWVDADRIGIWGWSYGGYMTLFALTHSQSFKVGIAGAPVSDWKNYDAIYTERYMGLPQDNVEGYKQSSVLGRAEQLRGRLLLIHGTTDDNVHLNNSLQFVKELQDAGIQFDMMFYPGNRHAISQPKQAAHLRRLMAQFILNHL
jgi:dipeptidyl-peptidase 4